MSESDALSRSPLGLVRETKSLTGTPPSKREMVLLHGEASVQQLLSDHGTWSGVVEAAGFDSGCVTRRVGDEVLLHLLNEVAEELGHPPSTTQFDRRVTVSSSTVQTRFGSWSEALEHAGLPVSEAPSGGQRRSISSRELLDEIGDVAETVDDVPTASDFDRYGEYSSSAVVNRFGSWTSALESAGFDVEADHLPDEKMRAELERVAEELGHPPTTTAFAEHGDIAVETYRTRYGDWETALERAGLEPADRHQPDISDSELISELRAVADSVGEIPSTADMDDEGAFHSNTYLNRFGSWSVALRKAEIVE